MELLWNSIKMDWPVLLPILICALLVVQVVIQRMSVYNKNRRDINKLIPRVQKKLAANDLQGVQDIAVQCGGVIGEVLEESVRIFSDQREGFSRSFDIVNKLLA